MLLQLRRRGQETYTSSTGGAPFRVLEKALECLPSNDDAGDVAVAILALAMRGNKSGRVQRAIALLEQWAPLLSDRLLVQATTICVEGSEPSVARYVADHVQPLIRNHVDNAKALGHLIGTSKDVRECEAMVREYREGGMYRECAWFLVACVAAGLPSCEQLARSVVADAMLDAAPEDRLCVAIQLAWALERPVAALDEIADCLPEVEPRSDDSSEPMHRHLSEQLREGTWGTSRSAAYVRGARACLRSGTAHMKDAARQLNERALSAIERDGDGSSYAWYCTNRLALSDSYGNLNPFVEADIEYLTQRRHSASRIWIENEKLAAFRLISCERWRAAFVNIACASEKLERFEHRDVHRTWLLPHLECANRPYALTVLTAWLSWSANNQRRDAVSVIRHGSGVIQRCFGVDGVEQAQSLLEEWLALA